jgi:hypothetical protein
MTFVFENARAYNKYKIQTGAIIHIFLKFAIFSMFRLSFQFGHIHVRLPNFHEYFSFFKYSCKFLTKVLPSSFLNFLMSKHMKFRKIRKIASVLDDTHVHFPKQMSLLYNEGTEQIIPTKKFEDDGTSIFAFGQRRYWCLPYPALWFPDLSTYDVCPRGSVVIIVIIISYLIDFIKRQWNSYNSLLAYLNWKLKWAFYMAHCT